MPYFVTDIGLLTPSKYQIHIRKKNVSEWWVQFHVWSPLISLYLDFKTLEITIYYDMDGWIKMKTS
jgi:hypothetical protein